MPLISAAPQTIKDKLIRDLRQLPIDLLKNADYIELICKKLIHQHDPYLEHKYKEYKVQGKPDALGDVFTYFKIGEWDVAFETEE